MLQGGNSDTRNPKDGEDFQEYLYSYLQNEHDVVKDTSLQGKVIR